MLYIDIRR